MDHLLRLHQVADDRHCTQLLAGLVIDLHLTGYNTSEDLGPRKTMENGCKSIEKLSKSIVFAVV